MIDRICAGGSALASAPFYLWGIVNATPDSFHDGGLYFSPENAIGHARKLWQDGAAILDIGGASSRPGAEDVPAEEEIRRVLPVVQDLIALRKQLVGANACADPVFPANPASRSASIPSDGNADSFAHADVFADGNGSEHCTLAAASPQAVSSIESFGKKGDWGKENLVRKVSCPHRESSVSIDFHQQPSNKILCGASPLPPMISVDTWRAKAAAACLDAGADIINDISAFAWEPELLDVVAQYRPAYVLMHCQGTPQTMQAAPRYDDIVDDVLHFFTEKMSCLVKAGLPEERIILDPGIGFGKSLEHNLALLRALPRFAVLGRPQLLGISYKTFLGALSGLPQEQRGALTQVCTALLAERGIVHHRVHDVAGARQALLLTLAMRETDHA